jgi:translation initiation factor 1
MAAKKIITGAGGLIYSTDPNFKLPGPDQDQQESIPVAQQALKIILQTKHRAGKAVTLIENYIGPVEEKEALCKKLKTFCGTGGSFKDGEIIVQGDNREKVLQWLLKNGYVKSKKA